MSRTSRIPHPTGGRFVQIHEWAVRAVGLVAAAVLGILDFLDRAQERPGRPVATRLRLLADMEGIATHNTVDKALKVLVKTGWVVKTEHSALGEKNLQKWFEYSINAEVIAAFLVEKGIAGIPKLGPPASLRQPQKRDSTYLKEEALSLSAKKEANDLALARRRGEKGGLTNSQIDDILADCQFPSQAPAAITKEVARQRLAQLASAAPEEFQPAKLEAALKIVRGGGS